MKNKSFKFWVFLIVSINFFTSLTFVVPRIDKLIAHDINLNLVYLYLGLHIPFVVYFLYLLFRDFNDSNGVLHRLFNYFWTLPIPKGAKIAVIIVLSGNFICISTGLAFYPFYDVGMFRYAADFKNPPPIVYKPKYYYYDSDNEVKILDLRKEGFFFLAEHFGLGYTHEFTFAAAFHNKAQKENFEFLLERLKPLGIDTLWVGVHSVDYRTLEVNFNPDKVNAVKINNTENIHYGPIYIPEYQMKLYEDSNRR